MEHESSRARLPGTELAAFLLRMLQRSLLKENHMNNDTIKGNWLQYKGKVKEQWGKLTDDDLDVVAGKRDQLVGRIQERYGMARDEADKEIASWETDNRYTW